MTREEWLVDAVVALVPLFPADVVFPPVKVSVGWPKGASDRKVMGQCFNKTVCIDAETFHMFISPVLDSAKEVLPVLLHELVHAVVGVEVQHRREFIDMAHHVGLERPWTQAITSAALNLRLEEIAAALGSYPHAALVPKGRVQRTRMNLYLCRCEPPIKIRTADSRKGPLQARCLLCGADFEKPVIGE